MLQIMLMGLSMMTTMIFMQMTHPLAMGLILLIQTTMISLMTGMIHSSFWFSYTLFLIFLGGMLVLFIYVASLASNEMFSMSSKTLAIVMISTSLIIMSMIVMDKILITYPMENLEMTAITQANSFIPENKLPLMKLYTFPTNMITLLLINYLLITLIVAVKITNVFYGPLRPNR